MGNIINMHQDAMGEMLAGLKSCLYFRLIAPAIDIYTCVFLILICQNGFYGTGWRDYRQVMRELPAQVLAVWGHNIVIPT